MTKLFATAALVLAIAQPALAMTMATTIPTLQFPDDTVTTSTKDCLPEQATTGCEAAE